VPVERPPQRPVMAQKILQQSREAESALADALVSPYIWNAKIPFCPFTPNTQVCSQSCIGYLRFITSVPLSAHMEQLVSHRIDLYGVL
jgi:hypothetical protein